MKSSPLLLTVFCSALLSLSTIAQNDSTRLDAGSMVFKRAFTQHISIRGEDLEKMPFANLADAINVWINGAYTFSSNLVYVVDGNIISDVNAYSVHDIEEVVFLQNAGALSGTAGSQQEMVLITTRKGKDKRNIRGAAQAFLVHTPDGGSKLYHQYFAGVDANYDKFSVGVSANYLRDIYPGPKPSQTTTTYDPIRLDRWRLNGNFTWRPDTKNAVEVHVGYVPQTMNAAAKFMFGDMTPSAQNYDDRTHSLDQQVSSWLRWRGEWMPGLRNDLQAGYLHMSEKGMFRLMEHYVDSPNYLNRLDSANLRTHQFFVRDRLSYTLHAGGWAIEPAVNASYNYVKDIYSQSSYVEIGTGTFGVNPVSYSTQWQGGAGTLWVLTPTLDISYKKVLNIQGGVAANMSKDKPEAGSVSLPGTVAFGSMAVDVLGLDGKQRSNSLKLFGSWSQRSVYYNNDYTLNDLDGSVADFRYVLNMFVVQQGSSGGTTTIPPPIQPVPPIISIPKYWVWEAGAQWSALQHRLEIDYNFQRRNFSTLLSTDPGGGGFFQHYLVELKSAQHRLGISYRILDQENLSWQSGLNVTRLETSMKPLSTPISGLQPWDDKPSYTGGWVNRVQCHRLSLGLDLLYHFGDVIYNTGDQFIFNKQDYWLAQNIYVGYKIPMPKKTGLEVYIDSRGLIRGGGSSSTSLMLNPRRYYGVGGKITI